MFIRLSERECSNCFGRPILAAMFRCTIHQQAAGHRIIPALTNLDNLPMKIVQPASDVAPEPSQARRRTKYRASVLFIGTHPPPDVGTRSVAEGLAEKLRANGFNSILTSRARRRIVRVWQMVADTWVQRHSYDLAHVDVYSGAAFRWAEVSTFLLRAIKKPVILTLHGGNLVSFARTHPRRMARLLSRADAVTTPSRYLAEAVRDLRNSIEVIPNPIETAAYAYVERSHPGPSLVWLRAFHRMYDPVLAIRVLARLEDIPEAHLTMIGPDKDGSLAEARAEANRRGVLQRVSFVGGVPKADVPRLLAKGDIFLNTSTVDNTPVSVIEAMATGLLVVSTSVGGVPYLITSGHDGILVAQGDADAMAAAVRRYLEQPAFAARVSRNARAKAENFSWDEVLPRWVELLTRISASNDRRNVRQTS